MCCKNRIVILMCVFGFVCSLLASGQTRRRVVVKPVDVDILVFDKELWGVNAVEFFKKPANRKFGFRWQSARKKALRSEGRGFRMFGVRAGESLMLSNGGKEIKALSISFYNRGDNGAISVGEFGKLISKLRSGITDKLATKPRTEKKKGTVSIVADVWSWEGSVYRLEASRSTTGRPEFLRLRAMSKKSAGRGEATASRSSLSLNVKSDHKTGEVYISNLPMVDQGRKGYCACASAARIYQYYGRSTDQHEIAQLAGSSARGGTSISEMVNALKKVTSKLNSRVNVLYEYPKGITAKELDYRVYVSGMKAMMRDINSYQQLAKKRKAKSIDIPGKKPYSRISSKESISFSYFLHKCDPKVFREVMIKKNSFSRFKSKIKEYIKQGIPVGWCLQLGLFAEEGIPQVRGGHMRVIIGYNEKTDKIIYTDSWGAGHAKKAMDAGEAFCMTSVLLVLPPTR